MNSAARERVEGRSHPFSFRPFSSSATGFLATRAPKALGAFHDKDTARRKADGERGAGIKGRKKEHENQFSPRLPLRSFMRNCTGLRNRKKHKSSPGNPVDSFLLQINDSLLPSISRFVQRVRLFSPSFRYRRILLCIYIYIHVVYTRTFLFHRLRFSVETFAQIAEKSVRQSRRIIRDVFVDRSRALNSKRGKRDRIKRGYYSSWPD